MILLAHLEAHIRPIHAASDPRPYQPNKTKTHEMRAPLYTSVNHHQRSNHILHLRCPVQLLGTGHIIVDPTLDYTQRLVRG